MKLALIVQILMVFPALTFAIYNLIYSTGLKKTEVRIGIPAPSYLDGLLKINVTFSILIALSMLLFLIIAVII